ncbi:MAG: hypothetical protein ACI4SX_05255 [Candidatus Fimenecus sp.]
MKISELPRAEKVNNEDVFPVVQDGETKKAPKEALQIPDDVGITDAGNLVLTVSGEKIGEGVPLPKTEVDQTYSPESTNAQSGVAVAETVNGAQKYTDGKVMRLINSIAVPDGETATMLKISKDVDGANFSLHNIMFSMKLILPAAQTVTVRLRTNGGQRYLVYKTGVAAKSNLFITGEAKVFSSGTFTNACYTSADVDLSGMSQASTYSNLATNQISKTNISDIEIFIYDASSNFVPLQAGSSIELWGC